MNTQNPTPVTGEIALVEIITDAAIAGRVEQTQPGPRPSTLLGVVDGDGTLLATAGIDLEPEAIAGRTGLPRERVATAAWLTGVTRAPGAHGQRAEHVAVYAALQRARIAGRHEVGATVVDDATPFTRQLGLAPLPGTDRIDVAGLGSFRHTAQRLDVALARAFEAADSASDPIAPAYLVREIGEFMTRYFDRIWNTAWFRAVADGTLTRGQYVYTLSNMHQFVRFTTRILGRCVAHADDPKLRVHFIRHLQEEVNHELIIERDLAAMGEDVAFVVQRMSPNLATRQFMAAQESAIGFHMDPILLMAAPLAAEGISGHLDQEFMDDLHANVRRWGVPDPERVTRFYSSHIELDGGDDGHWESTMHTLAAHVRTETALARFLSLLRVTTDAMVRCYDSWVQDLALT
jgi:hypothetical protein